MSNKENNATEAHCSLVSKTVVKGRGLLIAILFFVIIFYNNVIPLFKVFSHSPELSSKGNNVYIRISEEINLTKSR